MARTITINAEKALQDAHAKSAAADERKSLADVARAARGERPPRARFGGQRDPLLFTESVNAWQRALRQRKPS